ncbi:DUF4279 domain-containing protein [Solibacillus sp. FSL W7-1464]|uniref:DUF4279 domain-containing protein n=1 Tax=Solibacillus sp. FSL W7-1464 TaxID=2921706 RepID=UPI0030FC0CAF
MEQTSFYTYIKLAADDFPLEAVTERLGVEPTNTWKVGDEVRRNRSLKRFYTCWKYQVGPVQSLDVDDVLNQLYDVFNPKVDVINELMQQYDLNVKIVLVIEMENGQTPGLVISPAFSRFTSSLDALIDIDMYVSPFSEI